MPQIWELEFRQCRAVLTDEPPHNCCGAETALVNADKAETYCPTHKARYHRGPGKDARSLEEMIYALDKTVRRGTGRNRDNGDSTAPVDQEISRTNTKPKYENFGDEVRLSYNEQETKIGTGHGAITAGKFRSPGWQKRFKRADEERALRLGAV